MRVYFAPLIAFFSAACLNGQVLIAAEQSATAIRYKEVVDAFKKIVSGRSLASDEGSEINYQHGSLHSSATYLVGYSHSFPSGRSTDGVETVWTDGSNVFVDQVIDGVIARRSIASIEGPYNVLRMRPADPEESSFISRDCIRRSEEDGTECYVKVRYLNDVIVTVYREKSR